MMGSTEDPKDGAAVAATVFGAVIVYAVRCFSSRYCYLPSHVRSRMFLFIEDKEREGWEDKINFLPI